MQWYKFGAAVGAADVITCAKFFGDRLRGVDSVGVENCHLPLTKPVAVNTGLSLPRSLWSVLIVSSWKHHVDAILTTSFRQHRSPSRSNSTFMAGLFSLWSTTLHLLPSTTVVSALVPTLPGRKFWSILEYNYLQPSTVSALVPQLPSRKFPSTFEYLSSTHQALVTVASWTGGNTHLFIVPLHWLKSVVNPDSSLL